MIIHSRNTKHIADLWNTQGGVKEHRHDHKVLNNFFINSSLNWQDALLCFLCVSPWEALQTLFYSFVMIQYPRKVFGRKHTNMTDRPGMRALFEIQSRIVLYTQTLIFHENVPLCRAGHHIGQAELHFFSSEWKQVSQEMG